MLSGLAFFTGAWTDPLWLIGKTQEFFDALPPEKKLGDQFSLAAARIVERREWQPSLPIIEANLDAVIRELGIYYVPKTINPGPCIVFPMRDYRMDNMVTSHMIHPFYHVERKGGGIAKYAHLGAKATEGTPSWFGITDEFIRSVHLQRSVLLVEGFYDLLAVRLLHPGAPVISTGTKRVNKAHVQYLRMLNVARVLVMFDHERGNDGKEGAGDRAARYTVKEWDNKHRMRWMAVPTLTEDPSDALKDRRSAYTFRQYLRTLFPLAERKVV